MIYLNFRIVIENRNSKNGQQTTTCRPYALSPAHAGAPPKWEPFRFATQKQQDVRSGQGERVIDMCLTEWFGEKNASKNHIVKHGVPANQMLICGEKEQQR